jgi:Spy/CpxP family protein refolding chaperone
VGRRLGVGSVMILAAGLVVTAPVDAQRPQDGRRGRFQDREQLEQRIRAQMGRLMRERLGLSDEDAVALGEVVESFEGRRREIYRLEQETRREVDALREDPAPEQEAAAALLDRMVDLRAREARLFAEEQEALRAVLTPVQILELHALRAQIGQRIRALRSGRDGRSETRRRGGADLWDDGPRMEMEGRPRAMPGSLPG